jgi:hypothetical protein
MWHRGSTLSRREEDWTSGRQKFTAPTNKHNWPSCAKAVKDFSKCVTHVEGKINNMNSDLPRLLTKALLCKNIKNTSVSHKTAWWWGNTSWEQNATNDVYHATAITQLIFTTCIYIHIHISGHLQEYVTKMSNVNLHTERKKKRWKNFP